MEKKAFYVVILSMFQITVIWSILINSDYILRYLDMEGFRIHFKNLPKFCQFIRKGRPLVQFLHVFRPLDYNFMK